ncbi:MAG: GntR family transcriptional regulator [Albidovulum sp.]|nr:GntR family transcriptional regulator [Albidovulum sp.]
MAGHACRRFNLRKSSATARSETTSDRRLLAQLRRRIMNGALAPGKKISEVSVAKMFDVSRTPARLALRTLEVEGLIKKRKVRGFTVQKFDRGDASKAFEVRGVLEGLATGSMARNGMSPEVEARLRNALERMEAAIEEDSPVEAREANFQAENDVFRKTIMQHCGNDYVGFAFGQISKLPMAQLGTMVFDSARAKRELMRLRFGYMQHQLIVDAIPRRDAQRAEALMREHANQALVYSSLFAGDEPAED